MTTLIRILGLALSAWIMVGAAQAQTEDLDRDAPERSSTIRLNRNGAAALREGDDLDRAIAFYSNAIRRHPKDAAAFVGRARAYRSRGEFDRAIADCSEAIRLDPRYAAAYNARGLAYYEKGDPDRAIADYNEALRLRPRFASAFHNRGLAYRKKGNFNRSIANHSEAIRLAPEMAVAFRSRGHAYRDKGDLDRAIADYDRAIRLDPTNASAFYNRGVIYGARGDLGRAVADLSEAIRRKPKNATAFRNRGFVYRKKGDLDRAIADYKEAVRLNPEDADARRELEDLRVGLAARQAPATTNVDVALGRRVALVIGNSVYEAVQALPNPTRDAQAIAEALRKTGFQTVTVINNVSRAKFLEALETFASQAEAADWAVVYFAGHGIEMGGVNYLIPVDARIRTDRSVQDEAVALERITMSIEQAKKLRLVILDACRDNPFAQQMRMTVATRSVSRGLARVEPAGGTLVAYAAKHGQVAIDGEGQNSPFVSALVKRLGLPGVEIRKLFGLVRDDVLAATARQQEPYIYGTLGGDDFFFRPAQAN